MGRGFCAFSPWKDPLYKYSVLQLNLSHEALRTAGPSYFYGLSNASEYMFYWSESREKNYDLRSNFRALIQVASGDFTALNKCILTPIAIAAAKELIVILNLRALIHVSNFYKNGEEYQEEAELVTRSVSECD